MNKQLKHLLVRIAGLSIHDQQWILKRLSAREFKIFEQWNGLKLLNDAQRFRRLKNHSIPIPAETQQAYPLPDYCEQLATKPPLFSAIVLRQGCYSWATFFLKKYDTNGLIQIAISHQVLTIKPIILDMIFNEWIASISFESHLDEHHG